MNDWDDIVEPPSRRRGRKRLVSLNDFTDRILPAAQGASQGDESQATIRELFRLAKSLGIFPFSYATFRRRLEELRPEYRRQQTVPTFEEWLFHEQTGRWPARLKAFGRRRAQQEKQAWQKIGAEFQLECKEHGAVGLRDLFAKSLEIKAPTKKPQQ